MKLLGQPIADKWLAETRERVASLPRQPKLTIVQVGDDAASTAYVRRKLSAAEKVGIKARRELLPADTVTATVVEAVKRESQDADGVIVQLPLPAGVDRDAVLDAVPVDRDVDGLSSASRAALELGENGFVPATPLGIARLLEGQLELKGATVAILGMGLLVGKPLALLLKHRGAAVVELDKDSTDVPAKTSAADVLVASAGVPGLVGKEHVAAGQVVVDAGFSVIDGKPVGDVKSDEVEPIVKAVTPVPGGVGPLTVAALLSNVVAAAEKHLG